jgi:F-type H+-transporting ATPase subunit b
MMNTILLADFSVIKPDPGLIVWTSLIFLLIWVLLGRLAFKPIQKALRQRDEEIQASLDEAKRAREEMSNLKSENERLLAEAREERAKILRDANDAKANIISEAKEQAREEAQRLVANAKQEIENQRMAAITDLKNQVGLMSIEIAEKVLRKQLAGNAEQEAFVKGLVSELKLS